MRIPVDQVTAATPCPGVRSTGTWHYPRTASDRPITMPYLAKGPLGQHQVVMPSLCAREYLLPPHSDADSPGPVCSECRERLAALAKTRAAVAAPERPAENASPADIPTR